LVPDSHIQVPLQIFRSLFQASLYIFGLIPDLQVPLQICRSLRRYSPFFFFLTHTTQPLFIFFSWKIRSRTVTTRKFHSEKSVQSCTFTAIKSFTASVQSRSFIARLHDCALLSETAFLAHSFAKEPYKRDDILQKRPTSAFMTAHF